MRLLFITDFTEQFPYRLLNGILKYSAEKGEHWVVCKMPPSFLRENGMEKVADFASKWRADVVVGQFNPDDDLQILKDRGMVVIAQDYIRRFEDVPNITSDYRKQGAMVAERLIVKGFRNFAFFGNKGMCWSDERCEGFVQHLQEEGCSQHVYIYDRQRIENIWYYNQSILSEWLLSLPRPCGIMTCDDNQGIILLDVCSTNGIQIPFQGAVIGVDNDVILCRMSNPALSSLDVDIERGGYELAEMAEKMVHDPSYKGEDIILEPLNIAERMSSSVFATKDEAVNKAMHYIMDNLRRKIQVGDVLSAVPISRRLLEQRFLKETGRTIYQYISRARIEWFAYRLLSSKDSIAEIAASMDEPDAKILSRSFVSVKGCTPSQYRKKNLRKL